ncbi:MAG: acetyltransferase [Colwellia sp. Phe_37]|nr:MAG: acetyltransferase [Colwellia sp. Phe_37]
MRHRMYHSMDVFQRLDSYASALNVETIDLEESYARLLEGEYIFEEKKKEGIAVSVVTVKVESNISNALDRRFFDLLVGELPGDRVPVYGLNWVTLKDRMLRVWEQIYNILINKIPSHHFRMAWLRLGGAKIGKGSTIWRNTEVLGVENLVMGDDSVIAWHCQVDARSGLVIGDHVAIASHVIIVAGSHDLTAAEFWSVSAPIYIRDYAWIATRAIIAHGSDIGKGAVVTANTLVAKKVNDYKIVGGTGAKIMGERPADLNYKVGGLGLFTFLY